VVWTQDVPLAVASVPETEQQLRVKQASSVLDLQSVLDQMEYSIVSVAVAWVEAALAWVYSE
jgi:hypothetical protein